MNQDEKRNYLYNVIYRLSICILPLVVTPYVARVLGPDNVGVYAFSSTVTVYFILFAKLGLDNYGNRTIAASRENVERRSENFWSIYTMQIVASLLSVLIYILLIIFVFDDNSMVYWMQLMYLASALFDVSWFFYGMEKFRLTTIRSLISRMLVIIFVFAFVHSKEDLLVYTGIMAASFLIEQVLLLPFLRKYVKKVSIKKEDVLRHIVANIKLFIPLLAISIYNLMDKIMLGLITASAAVVAFYTYAENIINLPKGILQALDTVMLPRISNLIANNHSEEGIKKMQSSLRFNMFISCALVFGIAGVAPTFIPFFLGPGYMAVVPLTMQLAIVIIPMSITSVIQSHYLIPFKKDNVYIKAVAIGALVNLVINLVLIPYYAATGAIIGTLLAEFTVCIYEMFYIRKIYSFKQLLKTISPFLLCGLFEIAIILLLSIININILSLIIIQVIVGGSVYLLAVGIYLIHISKEFGSLGELIKNFK